MPVKSLLLPQMGGRPAIDRTLSCMKQLVRRFRRDPTIVRTARRILHAYGIERDDTVGEAKAIYRFLRRHVRYTKDPVGVELVQDPLLTLRWRTGDCDDISVLGASLAESIGLESRFLVYSSNGAPLPHHVLVEVRTRRGWTALDTVWDRGVGQTPPGTLELG